MKTPAVLFFAMSLLSLSASADSFISNAVTGTDRAVECVGKYVGIYIMSGHKVCSKINFIESEAADVVTLKNFTGYMIYSTDAKVSASWNCDTILAHLPGQDDNFSVNSSFYGNRTLVSKPDYAPKKNKKYVGYYEFDDVYSDQKTEQGTSIEDDDLDIDLKYPPQAKRGATFDLPFDMNLDQNGGRGEFSCRYL